MADDLFIHGEARPDDLNDLLLAVLRVGDVLDRLMIGRIEAAVQAVHRLHLHGRENGKQILHHHFNAAAVRLVLTGLTERALEIVVKRQKIQ